MATKAKFLKYFFNHDTEAPNPEIALQQNLFVFVTLSVSLFTFLFAVGYLVHDMPRFAVAQLVNSTVALGCLVYFRRTGKTQAPIHFLLTIVLAASIYRVYQMGGITAPTFFTYTIIPAYTAAVLPSLSAIIWTLLFCLVPLFFYFLDISGIHFTPQVSEKSLETARIYGIVSANAVVLFIGLSVRSIFTQFKMIFERQREEKAHLLRLVAHDIATPLTILNFGLNALNNHRENGQEKFQDLLNTCLRATESMSKLLDNVRNMEAIHAGKMSLNMRRVRANELLEPLVERFLPIGSNKNIQIVVADIDQSAEILTDEHLFSEHVLANLLSNSIKYSYSNGRVEISVSLQQTEVVFQISDYGIGIPQAKVKNIFNSQGATSTPGTIGEKGTGFGMPITKAVLDVLQGRIEIDTRSKEDGFENTGTTFRIYLPKATKA